MQGFAGPFVLACLTLCCLPAPFARAVRGEDGLPAVGSAGGPSRPLGDAARARWLAGRAFFMRELTAGEGLGAPAFNAASCATCHKDPAPGGAGGAEFDVIHPRGQGTYGADPVAVADASGAESGLVRMRQLRAGVLGRKPGQKHNQRRLEHFALMFEVRETPSLLGLGLIETIPDAEILRNEDPDDVNADGVRGVARHVTVGGKAEIGRFGWQADTPRLADFVCRALGGELGVTAPDQGRGFGLHTDGDGACDPEATQETLDDLAFFVATLAPPPRAEVEDAALVERGEALFERVGCATCHVPALYGSVGPVGLFSDLLLHQVQEPSKPDLRFVVQLQAGSIPNAPADIPKEEPPVTVGAFRTAPLWGVDRTAPYMHDGRSTTVEDAIGEHAVEAASARDAFQALGRKDRDALLAYVASR